MSLASRVRPALDHAAALTAALLPVVVALSLASPGARWRDDVALVRGLGLSPSPGAGAVSTLLFGFARLWPIGSVALRSTLIAALAAGATGYLLFVLARRVLDGIRASALNGLLALLAALSASLSPSLLREAGVGAGATVASALALCALLAAASPARRPAAVLGALFALLAAESAVAAVAVALALGAAWLASRRAAPAAPAAPVAPAGRPSLAGRAALARTASSALAPTKPSA
ncbi:MAG: hypothetical protein EOO75_09920, partial [Myxococcales bacterium]